MPSYVEQTPDQRIAEASVFLRGLDAVTGWAGLRWLGAEWFTGSTPEPDRLRPVPILTMTKRLPQAGFLFSEERISYSMTFEHDGLTITDPWRSVTFEMRYAGGLRRAVVALDMACHSDLVSIEEVDHLLTPCLNGWTGVPLARQAVHLASENSWSPQEVNTRLAWELDCGFPRPLCNAPVFDLAGHHLFTPDLFDPQAGLAGEYDGTLHLEGARRRRDRDREELARDHGIEYFTIMAGDLVSGRCVAIMTAARRRALFQAPDSRRWTLDQPHWWVPTDTVALRRGLTEEQRSTWLARRAG